MVNVNQHHQCVESMLQCGANYRWKRGHVKWFILEIVVEIIGFAKKYEGV